MKIFRFKKSQPPICALLALLQLAVLQKFSGQNCGCPPDLCCSQFGYCGTSDAYCGQGCRSGPCTTSTFMCYAPQSLGVADFVTADFFNGIANQTALSCPGREFYTRSAFLRAIDSFLEFGTTGSFDNTKRETAAFFAHVTHQTANMCYIEEVNGQSRDYCDETSIQWPCASSKGYYGRGPLQLSWNYNYGQAGRSIRVDLLNNPELVATDAVVSFKTALWFWMENCHDAITSGQHFSATIRAVYGDLVCDAGNPATVTTLVGYYSDYCKQFRVDPGPNLRC